MLVLTFSISLLVYVILNENTILITFYLRIFSLKILEALFARAFSVSTPLHSFSRPFSEFRNNLLKILLKTWRYIKSNLL